MEENGGIINPHVVGGDGSGGGSSSCKHYVLVHGVCHGAWCWYKLSTILSAAGHRVTALDLAGSGVDPRSLDDVPTFAEYSRPLTDFLGSLPEGERVVLVGHSFGGMSIALAMDMFPDRIQAAVFVAAFLPDSSHPPSYVIEEMFRQNPEDTLDDTQLVFQNGRDKHFTSLLFGPKCISSKLYNCSPEEDRTLAKTLVRTGSLFIEDLSRMSPFSAERFGSVKKFYVVCTSDRTFSKEFQRWMAVTNNPANGVEEVEGADHLIMLSKPQELGDYLMQITAG